MVVRGQVGRSPGSGLPRRRQGRLADPPGSGGVGFLSRPRFTPGGSGDGARRGGRRTRLRWDALLRTAPATNEHRQSHGGTEEVRCPPHPLHVLRSSPPRRSNGGPADRGTMGGSCRSEFAPTRPTGGAGRARRRGVVRRCATKWPGGNGGEEEGFALPARIAKLRLAGGGQPPLDAGRGGWLHPRGGRPGRLVRVVDARAV